MVIFIQYVESEFEGTSGTALVKLKKKKLDYSASRPFCRLACKVT